MAKNSRSFSTPSKNAKKISRIKHPPMQSVIKDIVLKGTSSKGKSMIGMDNIFSMANNELPKMKKK